MCVGDSVWLGWSGIHVAGSTIQQNSRKLLMMDILMSETCWAHKKWNKIASVIKLVFYSSTVTMIHGTINIRFNFLSDFSVILQLLQQNTTLNCQIIPYSSASKTVAYSRNHPPNSFDVTVSKFEKTASNSVPGSLGHYSHDTGDLRGKALNKPRDLIQLRVAEGWRLLGSYSVATGKLFSAFRNSYAPPKCRLVYAYSKWQGTRFASEVLNPVEKKPFLGVGLTLGILSEFSWLHGLSFYMEVNDWIH